MKFIFLSCEGKQRSRAAFHQTTSSKRAIFNPPALSQSSHFTQPSLGLGGTGVAPGRAQPSGSSEYPAAFLKYSGFLKSDHIFAVLPTTTELLLLRGAGAGAAVCRIAARAPCNLFDLKY